ncbi:aminotransferase class IV [Litoribacter ruber]|uniref:aminotransferase class IV n=1 Tax=Litoribacter ruber TaxID=702568 RepID=UPI001FE9F9BC|nr:aminotransferase class IV [Litoribacter ruber]
MDHPSLNMPMRPYCFAKNEIIPSQSATLHPADIGLIRGYAIFDFFRTVNHEPILLSDYLERFTKSAKITAIPLDYSKKELEEIISELIEKNDLKEGGVRMVLSGGISPNHFSPAEGSLFIFCEDLQMPAASKYENGVKLITSEYVRPIPEVKTTNYSQAVHSSLTWKENNVEDLIYHFKGIISESSRSNIFIVKDGILVTPKENILHGVTRKFILSQVPEAQVRDISLEEMFEADEVFMSSTTKRILPVTQVDDQKIGKAIPGKMTQQLLEKFSVLEKASSE